MAAIPTDRDPRHLRWARLTVIAVFVVGLILVVGPALPHLRSIYSDPFEVSSETRTVETLDANGKVTQSVRTTAPAGSLVDRSLAAGGVLLLRLAVVGIGAFMAGAVVYRTAAGNFPSEIAGVKFAERTSTNLDNLTEATDALAVRVRALESKLGRLDRASSDATANMAELDQRLDANAQDLEVLRQFADAVVHLGDDLEATQAEVRALKQGARGANPSAEDQ